jgi:hypothetical protein
LEIASFGIAELAGGFGRTAAFAFPFDEHGQLKGDFVPGEDGQGAGRPNEMWSVFSESDHGKNYGAGQISKIKYGGNTGLRDGQKLDFPEEKPPRRPQ